MARFYLDAVKDFDLINSLQYLEALAYCRYSDFFQGIEVELCEDITRDMMF